MLQFERFKSIGWIVEGWIIQLFSPPPLSFLNFYLWTVGFIWSVIIFLQKYSTLGSRMDPKNLGGMIMWFPRILWLDGGWFFLVYRRFILGYQWAGWGLGKSKFWIGFAWLFVCILEWNLVRFRTQRWNFPKWISSFENEVWMGISVKFRNMDFCLLKFIWQ